MTKKMMSVASVTAVLSILAVLLAISGCGDPLSGLLTYQLTIASDGNGTVDPTGTQTVNKGSSVSIKATPNSGYSFSSWTVTAGSGVTFANANAASTTVVLTSGSASIQANFTANSYVLTVGSDGNGTVSPTGNVSVSYGEATAITATAASGYSFLNWTVVSGTGVTFGNSNTASTTVSLTGGNATIQANFTQNVLQLTVNNDGNGTTNPAGSANSASGVATTITATASTGYHFVNWTVVSGTGVSFASDTSSSTTVTLSSGNATILANFAINTYQLTVSTDGHGTITAPASSPAALTHGVATTITATPATGYHFVNWSNPSGSATIANSSTPSTTVTLTSGDATVQANFAINTYTLTLNLSGIGSSSCSVTKNPATGPYTHGSTVTLTPYAAMGYTFDHWSGDISGTDTPFNLTITADTNVTAVFVSPEIDLKVIPYIGLPVSKASGSTVTMDNYGGPISPNATVFATMLLDNSTGTSPLVVSSLDFPDYMGIWALPGGFPSSVPAGSSKDFSVWFIGAPTPGTYTITLTIGHNDYTDNENPYTLTFSATVNQY